MATKRRGHTEEAWANAKTICRLNARQVEMARALGLNPMKLPRLRPSPQERWKLPVGAFIEECYHKRFGAHPQDRDRAEPEPRVQQAGNSDAGAADVIQDPMSQVEELVCYLMNLAEDLQNWLKHGTVTEVLPEVSQELRDIAKALDTGTWIPAVPEISVPPRSTRAVSPRRTYARRGERRWDDDDDDIPF